MRGLVATVLVASAMAALPAHAADAQPTAPAKSLTAEQQMKRIWAQNRYVILFAQDATAVESEKMAKELAVRLPKLSAKAELVTLDYTNEEHRQFAERWHVHEAPLVLAIAPGEVVTAYFRNARDLARLDTGFVPRAAVKIIAAIQNDKSVFLVVGGQDTAAAQNRNAARRVEQMLKKSVALVELDPGELDAKPFLARLGFNPDADPTTVFVISPKGQIVETLSGEVTTKKLLVAFQTMLVGKSGCGSMGRGPRATCE